MCDCLNKSEERLITHLSEQIGKDQKIKEVNKSDSGYTCKGLTLSKGGGWKVILPFEFKYTPFKKDGTPGKEKVYKTNVFPSFCPFCGKEMER